MIGSCLMISLKGPALLKEERELIISNNIAGVILFKRNIQSFKQTHKLCSELKSLTEPSPLIAIDLEGGEVDRFSHLEESASWPSPQQLEALDTKQIESLAKNMARQLGLLAIDINFAPVVDLLSCNNPLLNARVFGKSKEEIVIKAGAFVRGLIKGQIIPCLKHFPGHGGVQSDSHKTLPEDTRAIEDLKDQLEIFQTLFKKYPSWVMSAHIEFPQIEKTPATFSKTLLKDLLKKQMDFKEIVISDDIDMSALKTFSSAEKFFYSIKGGCDLILTGQKSESPLEIMNFFQAHPQKMEEIEKELLQSSKKLLNAREKALQPFTDFKVVEKELAQIQKKLALAFPDEA